MFDIILMDLHLPKIDGYTATAMIREKELQYGIKEENKHFICGYSSEADRCKYHYLYFYLQLVLHIYRRRNQMLEKRH